MTQDEFIYLIIVISMAALIWGLIKDWREEHA